MRYSNGFKARMVQRMVGPEGIPLGQLSREVGVSRWTLSHWRREARTLNGMGKNQSKSGPSSGPCSWSGERKLDVVSAASKLSDPELGEFLRKEGLHEAQLLQWRAQILAALSSPGRKKAPESKKIVVLERELLRKDRALAEVTALLTLSKKARELWGDEGDATRMHSGS